MRTKTLRHCCVTAADRRTARYCSARRESRCTRFPAATQRGVCSQPADRLRVHACARACARPPQRTTRALAALGPGRDVGARVLARLRSFASPPCTPNAHCPPPPPRSHFDRSPHCLAPQDPIAGVPLPKVRCRNLEPSAPLQSSCPIFPSYAAAHDFRTHSTVPRVEPGTAAMDGKTHRIEDIGHRAFASRCRRAFGFAAYRAQPRSAGYQGNTHGL